MSAVAPISKVAHSVKVAPASVPADIFCGDIFCNAGTEAGPTIH